MGKLMNRNLVSHYISKVFTAKTQTEKQSPMDSMSSMQGTQNVFPMKSEILQPGYNGAFKTSH